MKSLSFKLIFSFVLVFLAAPLVHSNCVTCHEKQPPEGKAVYVDRTVIDKSVHKGLECSECHDVDPTQRHEGTHDYLCGKCHQDEAEKYAKSPHVEGRTVSLEDVPTCSSCHGGHEILPISDIESPTNHINSVKICIKCHEDEKIKEDFETLPEPQMIKAYEMSVHGRALMVDNNLNAPACIDCHGSHSFLPSDRPESPIGKPKIAETCGKCHPEIADEYNQSVHGTALSKGVMESPTCTDCHGEHDIKAHLDPESKTYATNVPVTCSACHASAKVVGKYGLKADRIETFAESFHGTGLEFGETRFANCASCHGVHNIYPQNDPRSMIYKDNVAETCGKCHKDLPADFAKGTVHTSAQEKDSGQFYVRKFYYIFIPIIIIAFIIYRILEYKRRNKAAE